MNNAINLKHDTPGNALITALKSRYQMLMFKDAAGKFRVFNFDTTEARPVFINELINRGHYEAIYGGRQ